MALFLDTSRLAEIEQFHRMGLIAGVTTNPTILLKEGVLGGLAGIEARIKEIARLVAPLPVSMEVLTNDREAALHQALIFAGWADNMVIKVPVHGPEGEIENLELIHELETRHGVRVNATAMMSAQQGLLAATAGASYVSIMAGRVNNMGQDACAELRRLRGILDRLGLTSQIIAASTREILNVLDWLEAGAHIVTVLPDILRGMIVHPYTKETVRQFLRDGAMVEQMMWQVADDRSPVSGGGK